MDGSVAPATSCVIQQQMTNNKQNVHGIPGFAGTPQKGKACILARRPKETMLTKRSYVFVKRFTGPLVRLVVMLLMLVVLPCDVASRETALVSSSMLECIEQ